MDVMTTEAKGRAERLRKAGHEVAISAPLPDGVVLKDQSRGGCDLIIWFVRSGGELRRGVAKMAERLERGSIWIAWPKKGSPLAADLTQQVVREVGLAAGLVDYKVCAIDATWSGLLFTRRRAARR